eukprot:3872185-Rhodomonas_salina.2
MSGETRSMFSVTSPQAMSHVPLSETAGVEGAAGGQERGGRKGWNEGGREREGRREERGMQK